MSENAPLTSRLHYVNMVGTADQIEGATTLSRAVGWPYREEDWRLFASLGSGVLVMDGEKMVGSGLCWTYGDDFATCGSIIVDEGLRGGGVGRQIMERLLLNLNGRSVLLNATESGMPLYRKLGFRPVGMIHQHQGAIPDGFFPPARATSIRSTTDMTSVLALDRGASGVDRSRLVTTLADMGETAVLDGIDGPEGYAICRSFGRGYVIGPIVARDVEAAKALITHFLHSHIGRFLRVDVTINGGLRDWLMRMGLFAAGDVTSMILGDLPARSGPGQIIGLASQSLG